MDRSIIVAVLLFIVLPNIGCWAYNGQLAIQSDQCTQNGTGGEGDNNPIPSPDDNALHGIYSMSKTFMEELVEVKSLSETLEAIDSNPESIVSPILNYMTGYIIATIVGLVFIIMMPICGCCFCLCRTCCCCCCKKRKIESCFDKCKRTCCGVVFIGFLIIFSVGMAFTFASASFLDAQLKSDGIPTNLANSLGKLDVFFNDTTQDFWNLKEQDMDPMLSTIGGKLEHFPTDTFDALGADTGASEELKNLESFTKGLLPAKDDFTDMKTISTDLGTGESTLNASITQWITKVTNELATCDSIDKNECDDVQKEADNFRETLDIASLSLENLADPVIAAINEATKTNQPLPDIETSLGISLMIWNEIGSGIINQSSATLGDMTEHMETFSSKIEGFMNGTTDMARGMNTKQIQKSLVEDFGPALDKYSGFIYIVLLLPCFIPLSIAFAYLLGIVIGCTTGPPSHPKAKKKKFCHRGKGACCLMCGISLTYILASLAMLFTLIFFLVGSVSHNVLCKHLVAPEESDDVAMINNMVKKGMNSSIDFLGVFKNCKENEAIYTALNIEEAMPEMNISELLDLSKLGFDEVLGEIGNLVIIGNNSIELMNDALEQHLRKLESEFSKFNFQPFHDASGQTVTSKPVKDLKQFLEEHKMKVKDVASKNAIANVITELESTVENDIKTITDNLASLKANTTSSETYFKSMDINATIDRTRTAGGSVNDPLLRAILQGKTTDIFNVLEKMTGNTEQAVRCDIGQCKSLTSSVGGIVSSVCVFFLYPFNAYWFCIGWATIMMVPLLTLAVILVDQYRRLGSKYSKNQIEPEERVAVMHVDIPRTGQGKGGNRVSPSETTF